MKRIFIFASLFAAFFYLPAIATYSPDEMGCTFMKPPDWKINYHSDAAILLTDSVNEDTRIEIYKYLLDADHQISSEEELIEAVHGLYDEIGVDVNTDAPIECTIEDSLVYFETDFIDSTTESDKYHVIIRGILGRLEGDGQLLFLIKAVTPQEQYELSRGDINLLLHSFQINDPLEDEFFVHLNTTPYFLIFFIILLTAFFYVRNRRIQKSRNPLGRDSGHFWRCPKCRLVNHINSQNCQRCGWRNETIKSPQR
jgi:hypothetical protein